MRVIRIFQSGPVELGQTYELSAEAGLHVGVVLRMHIGEWLILFCGDNREYRAQITSVNKKKVTVVIQSIETVNRESPRTIHLAQAISKGDRMEWVVQKAVELGVSSITPLITSRCVVRLDEDRLAKKLQQWQAIAISACEQSGRNVLPTIHTSLKFDAYLQQCRSSYKLILEPNAALHCREICFAEGDVALLIGPEGGLSEDEVMRAQQHQFQALRLGPRILRTETAAITALSILQAMAGDL